jgi:hypothetical protein
VSTERGKVQPEANQEYLDKQFGKPVDEAIFDMLHAAECPACKGQSSGPTREAKEAVAVLNSLASSVRGFVKKHLQT